MQDDCKSNKGFIVQQPRVRIPIHALPHLITWNVLLESLCPILKKKKTTALKVVLKVKFNIKKI